MILKKNLLSNFKNDRIKIEKSVVIERVNITIVRQSHVAIKK